MITNNECYILALIKRDDGERLLLGSGYYEFTAGQKHFNPNQFANDVVELQGTDGQLLAGQVRRSTSQVFEGIIGDGTTSKEIVEQKRREFFLFFRKQHHYTVVYIMPDGTAIKRERGYITDAPAVQELYQFQPKWHIALAFEDVNYYSYAEDAQGNEVYSFEATLALANIADGGLVWDDKGAISDATGLENIRILGNTFQQSYDGGNLYNETIEVGTISSTTGEDTTAQNRLRTTGLTSAGFGGSINITATNAGQGTLQCAPRFYRADGSYIGNGGISWLNLPATVNPITDTAFIRLIFRYSSDIEQDPSNIQDLQIKASAVPSPNHPQSIQTVTGLQTVTINGTDYPLNLDNIELCGLGDDGSGGFIYKDHIFKDGDDWKVHKETAHETRNVAISGIRGTGSGQNTSSEAGAFAILAGNPFWLDYAHQLSRARASENLGKYLNQPSVISNVTASDMENGTFCQRGGTNDRLYFRNTALIGKTGNEVKEILLSKSGGTNAWWSLETPTDTVITNQTLIAQLDAIAEAMDADGKPTAIVPTGQNLAAIITGEPNGTGGYIFAPSTGGGPVVVMVNGVDKASPVWHVYGPATNPILTNSTTGEALTWNGTVPANQELIIDMGAQTATLEGANVFEYVSGSWVQLEPGANRISYSAGNTTKSSKVYWNEVVG